VTPYYSDDLVTIYHGDCRSKFTRREFAALGFDVVVTDPPYGMGYQHGFRKGGQAMGNDGVMIHGDDEPFDPTWLIDLGKPTVLFGANHYADRLPSSRGWLIWDKRDGDGPTDQSDAEMAWTNHLTTVRLFSARWRGAMRQGREQAEGRVHINQKPIALMEWVLGYMPAGAVIDPYMGSGSTLVAAKDAGRKAIGIEIEERYCEIAATRCSQEVLGLVG
jgi:site-specific DNA-methyltransferase (adenine-specific)